MTFFITKADLPDFVKFSVNIADNLINPDIRDAHEFDVLPLLSPAVVAACVAYRAVPAADVAAYLALPEAEQVLSPLHRPYRLYAAVRGLLCHESYRRFLLGHGVHITPNGAETISDVGHQPITTAQRTELRSDAQAKCSIYRAKLLAALRVYEGPSATTCHSRPSRPGAGGLKTSAV